MTALSALAMVPDKKKLKLIWRLATSLAIILSIILFAVYLSIGAEIIAAIILAIVSGVLIWYALILTLVPIMAPGLSAYVSNARVERVDDEIEVESSTIESGDSGLDGYVEDYARARDFWGKTAMMILTAIFLALLYYVFGVPS